VHAELQDASFSIGCRVSSIARTDDDDEKATFDEKTGSAIAGRKE